MAFDSQGRFIPDGQPQQQQPAQQNQLGQNIEQVASRGGGQSVQNYMTALRQNQAFGNGNNAMMNAPGQLGQGPQAGFQGFQSNGMGYGPQFVPQGYTGPMQTQLGYQGNQASFNPNYRNTYSAQQGQYGQAYDPQAYSIGVVAGGTGGLGGQPQWMTPQPWRNIGNADQGTPGSLRANSGDAQYTAGTYNNPENGKQPAPTQSGSFYTDRPPEGTYDPNEGYPNPPPPNPNAPTFNPSKLGTVSDENAKTNISSAKGELEEFLDNLGVYSYEYKNKEHGAGKYISPMAQEIEKSKLGKESGAVMEDQHGTKMVNYARLMGVQLAALAMLNKKQSDLESRFKDAVSQRIKAKKHGK